MASILGVIFRSWGQPLILAYLLTGLLLSPFKVGSSVGLQLDFVSTLGISFLLFTAGMQMSLNEIKKIGWPILRVGLSQIILSTIFGFGLALILGFSNVSAFILGLALSFSSTVAVIKVLTDKGEMLSLHGRLALGILLLQDLAAILALVVLTAFGGQASLSGFGFGALILKGIFFGGLIYFLTKDFVPFFFDRIARSSESLILGAISWCLILAAVSSFLGFSFEMGAFLAGLSLATTPFALEVSSRIKPLRDFFLGLFFVALGLGVNWNFPPRTFWEVVLFGFLLLFIKPVILYLLLKLEKYQKRPSFLAALSLGQASEFSLILLSLAVVNLKLDLGLQQLAIVLVIGSVAASSAIINCSKGIYARIKNWLPQVVKPKFLGEKEKPSFENGAVIFGLHRIGEEFLALFQKLNVPTLAVDIDPAVVEKAQSLDKLGIVSSSVKRQELTFESHDFEAVYGDASDLEFLESLELKKIRFLISTIPDLETNLILLRFVKKENPHCLIIVTAQQKGEAVILYQEGASYVILPHVLSGRAIAHLLGSHLEKPQVLLEEGQKHWKEISLAR